QAEDGIRAFHVTGVQTCALPICPLVGLDSNIEPTGGRSSWLPPEPGRVPGGSRNDTDFQAENAYDMAVSARRRRDCIEDPLSFGGDRCAPGTPCPAANGPAHRSAG